MSQEAAENVKPEQALMEILYDTTEAEMLISSDPDAAQRFIQVANQKLRRLIQWQQQRSQM